MGLRMNKSKKRMKKMKRKIRVLKAENIVLEDGIRLQRKRYARLNEFNVALRKLIDNRLIGLDEPSGRE